MHIFADAFTKVTLSNNNLRVTLVQNGPDNTQEEVAKLILPANKAAQFVNEMVNTLNQLDEQLKAKKEESPAALSPGKKSN
jgi:hypothetical protein